MYVPVTIIKKGIMNLGGELGRWGSGRNEEDEMLVYEAKRIKAEVTKIQSVKFSKQLVKVLY